MPTTGSFKKGDRVVTPSGRHGTVKSVDRQGIVNVKYDEALLASRTFRANALRYENPRDPHGSQS